MPRGPLDGAAHAATLGKVGGLVRRALSNVCVHYVSAMHGDVYLCGEALFATHAACMPTEDKALPGRACGRARQHRL